MPPNVPHAEFNPLRYWLVALLAGLLAVAWLPAPSAARGLAGYAPLHTAIETLAIAVAGMIFGISWVTQKYRTNRRALVLGVTFLGVALLDLSHTLSYPDMPAFVTPSGAEKAINFWLVARSLAAVGMLWIAVWPDGGRWKADRRARWLGLGGVLLLVALLHWVLLAHPEVLPRTFVSGQGLTPFKLAFEYGLIMAYLLAGVGYLRRLRQGRAFGASHLAAAALTMAMSEFFFTLYANVTDIYNLLGHVYKVVAYGFLFRALFVDTVRSPYQELLAAREQQQATLDTLPDLLFELDREGVYRAVHATEAGKLAAPAGNMVGRNIREVLPPNAADLCFQAMLQASREGVSRGTRIELAVPEGVRHFELSVASTPHALGGEGGYLVLSRDVTQVVRQEQRVRFEAALNVALLELQGQAEHEDEPDFLRRSVLTAEQLTDSTLAFIHLVHDDQQQMALGAWSSRRLEATAVTDQPPPTLVMDRASVWAEALRLREPVVVNASAALPQARPGSRVLAESAPQRLVSVPVVDGTRVNMVLVVAGRSDEYRPAVVQALRILAVAIWNLIKRRRQEAVIHRLSEALDQSPYPVVITGVDVRIQYVNRAFTEVSGYPSQEVLGHNPRLLQSGQTPKSTYAQMWRRLSERQSWQGEFVNRRKDGRLYVERALVYPIHDATGQLSHYVAHKEDVTQRKAAEERMRQLAEFDALTGLPNKKAFDEQLAQAVVLAKTHHTALALLWLNLDNFKSINDSMGHTAGDEMLLEISRRLRSLLGPQALLARYSGDSFLAVLPSAEQSVLALLVRDLLVRLQDAVLVSGSSLSLSASVGIATYPGDASTPGQLAVAAETAMYRVKEEGRNGFRFFAPDMQAHTQRSLELATGLKQAAARGELFVFYQPQLELAGRRLSGAEALLRWRHPRWGLVSPGEFIPLAEQTGAIVEIGLWVISQVAEQLARWQAQGLPRLCVAVNVSAIQFAQPDLFDQVTAIVERAGVGRDQIEIELTEAVALRDPVGAGQKIRQFHDAGFRVSIDDFGTGYSSMSHLKRYAVDKLKIDQSFIRDLATDESDQAIVTAIVKMAQSLGLSTIAEGVETPEQLAFLEAAGCQALQGYWYARPMEAAAFEAFVLSLRTESA